MVSISLYNFYIIIEALRCIPEPRILNVNYPVIKN